MRLCLERMRRVGQTIYIRWCTYGNFCRDIIKHIVIYSVYIRFWPTLCMRLKCVCIFSVVSEKRQCLERLRHNVSVS
jgi:hypothetical protein